MYNSVAGRDESIAKIEDREMKKIKDNYDIALKALDLQIKQNEANGITGKYDKISSLTDTNSMMGINVDKDGNYTFTDYDPMSAIDSVSKSQNYDPAQLFRQYTQATGQNVEQKASTGSFESELNAYAPALSEMYQVAAANPDLDNGYQSIKDTIKSGLTRGLATFLANKKEILKEAINSLSGKGWTVKKISDRAKFIATYSELGDVAGLLFDIDANAPSGIGDSSLVDEQFDLLVQQLALQATNGTNQ
jgi:hypothetical protein